MIRPDKIYRALFWLKENHPSYKDIEIKDFESWMSEPSLAMKQDMKQ